MYEVCGETPMQIILAVRPGDSIRNVAQRLHTPYETVREAVNRLEAAGYLTYDNGLYVTDDGLRERIHDMLAASATVSPPAIEDAYVIPQFGERPFAFTRIDVVYVWTHGGYQVGRSPDDYPLFLAVRETDVDDWRAFFEDFGLPTAFERQPPDAIDSTLQIVLDPQPTITSELVDGYPVIPREETLHYMRDNFAQFQSGLAMLDRMYDDLDLDVDYHEGDGAAP